MHALRIVILKGIEFVLQIGDVPEEDMVKGFASNGSDQSLDEGM